jgi:hypothetical protein
MADDAASTPTPHSTSGVTPPPAADAAHAADATHDAHIEQPPAGEYELTRLDRARYELLRVHRALLESERARYEKVRGRIANNSAFLQLVINDPWFDWLRPMAQFVLLIDERTGDKKSPLGGEEARALFDRARALLKADAEGDAFQRLFAESVQSSPELAVLARQVAASLGG